MQEKTHLENPDSIGDFVLAQLYWGDLHYHTAVGYAQGSLRRSFEIAREHLDFVAHTGHSQWPDMPEMPQQRHMKWVNGFEVMRENWGQVVQLNREFYKPGKLVTFLGYEWHHSHYGDYHLLYPGEEGELVYHNEVSDLQKHAKQTGAVLIPHHVAYAPDWRGFNWKYFDPEVSPVVEVYSEHGETLSDRTLFPMIRHSNGGIYTANTVGYQLQRGLRAGFSASTDDHFGYPGAWGEGLTGIWASKLTRESLWEALWQRRTYAVTGDRIRLEFFVNDSPMGSEIELTSKRNIKVGIEAMDDLDVIEVIKNGQIIHREYPDEEFNTDELLKQVKTRFEYGWGPWAALDMARVCDWDIRIDVTGGQFLNVSPCFQSGPMEEERRDKILNYDKVSLHWQSYTSRRDAFAERATKHMILKLSGTSNTRLSVTLQKPCEMSYSVTLDELADTSHIEFTGQFTSESILIHRLVFPNRFAKQFSFVDEDNEPCYYYIRARQSNGQMAWSSPIWVG
jgi:hypothetical protein